MRINILNRYAKPDMFNIYLLFRRNEVLLYLIGMRAYDTCYQPSRAMQAVMDFYPQYSAASMYCNDTGKLNLGE